MEVYHYIKLTIHRYMFWTEEKMHKIDMKSAANNYTSGNPYGIDRETYDKLIQGLKKLANSSNGLK